MQSDAFEQQLKSLAQELGISDIKRIPVIDIDVYDWVILKCQYGCPNYGRRLTCPPYAPAPEKMKNILESYSTAYLLRYDVPGDLSGENVGAHLDGLSMALDAFFRLERFAFLNGYRKAFSFGLNYCPECEECTIVDDPDGKCRFPITSRPSMEACGIDVQQVIENAGWEKEVRGRDRLVKEPIVSMISLLLVE